MEQTVEERILENEITTLAANILRIMAGGGEDGELRYQLRAVVEALVKVEVDHQIRPAVVMGNALRMHVMDMRGPKNDIINGALRLAAAGGRDTRSESKLNDGIRWLNEERAAKR